MYILSASPCASCLVCTVPLQALGLPVVGSQVVGLLPLKALLDAADFYIQKEQLFVLEEEHKVRLVSLCPTATPERRPRPPQRGGHAHLREEATSNSEGRPRSPPRGGHTPSEGRSRPLIGEATPSSEGGHAHL